MLHDSHLFLEMLPFLTVRIDIDSTHLIVLAKEKSIFSNKIHLSEGQCTNPYKAINEGFAITIFCRENCRSNILLYIEFQYILHYFGYNIKFNT